MFYWLGCSAFAIQVVLTAILSAGPDNSFNLDKTETLLQPMSLRDAHANHAA